jgi:hypothetical protein
MATGGDGERNDDASVVIVSSRPRMTTAAEADVDGDAIISVLCCCPSMALKAVLAFSFQWRVPSRRGVSAEEKERLFDG